MCKKNKWKYTNIQLNESKQTLGDSERRETDVLQSMGSQRIGHNLVTEQQQHKVGGYILVTPNHF